MGGEFFGGPSHDRREGHDGQRGGEEDPRGWRMEPFQRHRDREK